MAGARARKIDLSGLISLGGQANAINAEVGRSKAAGLGALGNSLRAGVTLGLERRDRAAERNQRKELADAELSLRDKEFKAREKQSELNNKFALLEILGKERATSRNDFARLQTLYQQAPDEFIALGLGDKLEAARKALEQNGQQFSAVAKSIGLDIPGESPGIVTPGGAARQALTQPQEKSDPRVDLVVANAKAEQHWRAYNKAVEAGDYEGAAAHHIAWRKYSGSVPAITKRLHDEARSILQNNIVRAAETRVSTSLTRSLSPDEHRTISEYVMFRTGAVQEANGTIGDQHVNDIINEVVDMMNQRNKAGRYAPKKAAGADKPKENEADKRLETLRANNPVAYLNKDGSAFQAKKDAPFLPPGQDIDLDPGQAEFDPDKPSQLVSWLVREEMTSAGTLDAIVNSSKASADEKRAAAKAQNVIRVANMQKSIDSREARKGPMLAGGSPNRQSDDAGIEAESNMRTEVANIMESWRANKSAWPSERLAAALRKAGVTSQEQLDQLLRSTGK